MAFTGNKLYFLVVHQVNQDTTRVYLSDSGELINQCLYLIPMSGLGDRLMPSVHAVPVLILIQNYLKLF